jgi:hypothetical protein
MKRYTSSYLLLCMLSCCLSSRLSSGYDYYNNAAQKAGANQATPLFQNNGTNNNTNSTNTTTFSPTPAGTTPPPAPPTTGSPTTPHSFTHAPTKKYIPEPDNDDENNDNTDNTKKKNGPSTGTIIFWWLASLAIITFLIFYFHQNIAIFCMGAYRNTQRYGIRGMLRSIFPCFTFGLPSDAMHQPLDQIIFETDESSYTRSNLREGLM